ncbi:MAG: V-type ATP synthase subunit E family protein [Candidatus Methanomethyliaceae archaeon]|nr:V-type ATP synthase subunit E family protein [Candidatus Methanomethyliaceae archaeon]
MATIEDKIRLFSKIIYDRVKEEKQSEFDALELERITKISELRRELEARRQQELKEAGKAAKIKAMSLISDEKTKAQQEQLKLTGDLMELLISEIVERLKDYISTEGYRKTLVTSICRIVDKANYNECVVYLAPQDYQWAKEEINTALAVMNRDIDIMVSEKKILGGYLIEDKNKKFRIDNSFQNKLQDMKGYIGLRVSEIIE